MKNIILLNFLWGPHAENIKHGAVDTWKSSQKQVLLHGLLHSEACYMKNNGVMSMLFLGCAFASLFRVFFLLFPTLLFKFVGARCAVFVFVLFAARRVRVTPFCKSTSTSSMNKLATRFFLRKLILLQPSLDEVVP